MTKMLIVESAAKARTIQKYLKDGWAVLATGGHVQDLPSGREHGKAGRKATFAEGRDGLPNAPWVWTERGEQSVRKIFDKAEAQGVDEFFLATDPDREGEFIAWRLEELLADKGDTKRVTFHEVTADAIKEALKQPREVDMHLVQSASVRKFLDRFVGFRTSKIARAFLSGGGKASMGRVQTPTLGFIVERELEREAHVPIPFFEVRASATDIGFQVRFHEKGDDAGWLDDNGKLHPTRTSDAELAQGALQAISAAGRLTIAKARRGSSQRKPKPAFSTDALLQAAGNRWGWSPGKTMRTATSLYEAGHITYIRTDSTRMSDAFVATARAYITNTWDASHLGPGAKQAAPTGKVQDAHEAIRPTVADVLAPDGLEAHAQQLYTLVRAQALASQMSPATFARIGLTCEVDGLDKPLTGGVTWRTHAGWQAAFSGLDKAPAEAPPATDLSEGAHLGLDPAEDEAANPLLVEDATKPPGRYRAHTVVRTMKDNGIGRPSTYASTVETLVKRRYVEVEDGAMVPTPRGRALWLEVAPLYDEDSMEEALFSVAFTSAMESQLDSVENGTAPARDVWARYRDTVRSLHNAARAHMNSGLATPKRVKQLSGLLEKAPADFERPEDVAKLTQEQALAMITELRGLGVQPPPTEAQLRYIRNVADKLQMDEAAAAGLVDAPSLEALESTAQASELVELLKVKLDEERPASPKQLGLIRSLVKKAGLEEAAAAAMVGAEDFGGLTGGRSGTASALIDALRAKKGSENKET